MKTLYSKIIILLCIIISSSSLFSQTISVYVSDAGGFNNPPWFIYKFDENGENPQVLLDEDDGIIWPEDILFLEDQNVALVTSLSTAGIIGKYNATTWEFIENFAEGIAGPTRMKIGYDNLIYVLQWSNTNNKVLRYQQDGTFVDEFTSVGVPQSIGLDWDANGNLYVSSYGGSTIRKFDTDGNDLGLFISSGLAGPTNIWFDKNQTGDLIVLNWNNGTVKRFDSDGNFVVDILTGLSQPEGVDFFPNGDILIGNGGDGAVKRYDNTFNFIENFIEPGLLITPNAVVIREEPIASVNDYNEQNIISETIGSTF
ncbi:MAG: hypothetical protein KUG68_04440, partial [Flavobacteriaceae bacterium]|nr:hypothetical protein [Flavobacteriaceae bacterium]